MPIINNADPILRNLPKPSMANGQIAGHMIELANPNAAINRTEVNPLVNIAMIENMTPRIAKYLSALACEINLGMAKN